MKSPRRLPEIFSPRPVSWALAALLALAAPRSLHATWTESDLGSEFSGETNGAYDSVWQSFWYGTWNSKKLMAVYKSGGVWTEQLIASNFSTSAQNAVAVDSSRHWTYYTGDDGFIWIAYFDGSVWQKAKVGSNNNAGGNLCVDSVWHNCYYTSSLGTLWLLYWNGSAWIEMQINPINRASGRTCGVDEVWHIVWNVTSDGKQLLYTLWDGSAWTSTWLTGDTDISATANHYRSIAVHGPTHMVYGLQLDASDVAQALTAAYWTGSVWTAEAVLPPGDGNLPTDAGSTQCLVASPETYSCYYGAWSGVTFKYRCLCTTYSSTAKTWISTRQDSSAMGGGGGLFPVAAGLNGRAILCPGGNSNQKVLSTNLP